MVMEFITQLISYLSQVNSIILIAVFLIFIILAYKLFQTAIKAVIVGIIAAAFPFVASFLGFNVPLTLNSVLWFALTGVILYFAYAIISGGIKIVRIVMSPFRRLFRKKSRK